MTDAERNFASGSGDRLIRLLAMLAYLAEVGEATFVDLSDRFALDERSIVSELELAACCGLPPYTPAELLELVVEDDRVVAFGLAALRRPPRLTPDEGFALAASARAMLAATGATSGSPLARALGKLESALGESHVQIEIQSPENLGRLRTAVAEHEVIEIDYLGAERSQTTRRVEPASVVALDGTFYLDAFCHLANDWRRFSLSRIRDIRSTDEKSSGRTPPPEFASGSAFVGGPRVRLAKVRVPASRAHALERLATGPGQLQNDGTLLFEIEVADASWFGRLLLRLGSEAVVIEPPELEHAAATVAAKALLRYETSAR
ncbi:MAG TPA: WYL domain-containing protein [Acidimicrobiales bacterium]